MKTARIHSPADLRLHDEPIPTPNAGEVLVRVGAVGICGSDLHWFSSAGIGDTHLEHPLVLGHEIAGWTESGQLVAVDPSIPCGSCEYCQTGYPNLCPEQRFAGFGRQDGGLQEYLAWPEACLYPLLEGFNAADGVMLEPLGVAIYALELSRIQPGESVGVFGLGPIGNLVAQMAARSSGAKTLIATERRRHRLDTFKEPGVEVILADGKEASAIHKITNGRGLDLAIEAAGEQGAVDAALEAVRPGGRVVLVGIPSNDQTVICASMARRKGLTLQWVRRMKFTYPRAIELVRSKQVDVRSLVTHQYPLENVTAAFQAAYEREGMKIVVTM